MSGTRPGTLPRGGPGQGGPAAGLTVPVEKAADFGGTARRLVRRLGAFRRRLLTVALLGACSVGLSVLGPKLLGAATTQVFNGYVSSRFPLGATTEQVAARLRAEGLDTLADMITGMSIVPGVGVDFGAVGRILALTLGVYGLSALLGWAQAYLMAGVTQEAVQELRREAEDKIHRLPLRYFDTQPRGDLLSRVTNDIDNISTTIQQVMMQLLTALLTVFGVLGMMLWISPLLAAISLLVVPLSLAATMVIARRAQPHFKDQWRWTGQLNAHVEEMTTGHDLVKVHNRADWAIAEFDTANDGLYRASFKAQFISGIIQPTMMFIGNVNYVLIAVVGGFRVASGQLPIGDVQAFIQYSRQFTMPITQIASVANLMQSGVASAERVFAFLDAADESPDPAQRPQLRRPVRGEVRLRDVSFRYVPDKPLIEGLDLVVEPGRTIAIVGPTGAGKTTLVNLLLRFYELDGGTIEIDGVDIASLPRDEVRRCFSMVLQDTWLFGGTIEENIAYGRSGSTPEEVRAAARAAYVDRFVQTLPEGYRTLVADDSASLSAGERQLITIARAFLADAPILILDEATSSVDTRTEVLIQRAMNRLRADRTSFVIAHRLSTIRDADTILVMVDGSIVEQGDHDQLLARDGHYAALYRAQFAGPMGAADPGRTGA